MKSLVGVPNFTSTITVLDHLSMTSWSETVKKAAVKRLKSIVTTSPFGRKLKSDALNMRGPYKSPVLIAQGNNSWNKPRHVVYPSGMIEIEKKNLGTLCLVLGQGSAFMTGNGFEILTEACVTLFPTPGTQRSRCYFFSMSWGTSSLYLPFTLLSLTFIPSGPVESFV